MGVMRGVGYGAMVDMGVGQMGKVDKRDGGEEEDEEKIRK